MFVHVRGASVDARVGRVGRLAHARVFRGLGWRAFRVFRGRGVGRGRGALLACLMLASPASPHVDGR